MTQRAATRKQPKVSIVQYLKHRGLSSKHLGFIDESSISSAIERVIYVQPHTRARIAHKKQRAFLELSLLPSLPPCIPTS